MPVFALHFTWAQPKLFLTNLKSVHTEVLAISYMLQNVACSLTCSLTHCFSLYIPFIVSLYFSPTVRCTHSQAGKGSTHTFSLNTLNLNSLLISRYVTSLTSPSSPSFSPTIASTHPCFSAFIPLSSRPPCFLPSPFVLTHCSSFSLSSLPFPSPSFLSVPAPSEEPVSTQQPHWKQCLIWKLIKSVFLPVFLLLFSSQACLSGWETAVTLSQMNLP